MNSDGNFSKLAEPEAGKLETHLQNQTVAATDATTTDTDGKQTYIRNISNRDTVVYYETEHAECNVHILRYLKNNTEETGNTWSGKLALLLLEIHRERKHYTEDGRHKTSVYRNTGYFSASVKSDGSAVKLNCYNL